MLSQIEAVLKHMEDGGEISPQTARDRYGVLNLPSFIHRLRQRGVPITTRRTVEPTPDTLLGYRRVTWYGLDTSGARRP